MVVRTVSMEGPYYLDRSVGQDEEGDVHDRPGMDEDCWLVPRGGGEFRALTTRLCKAGPVRGADDGDASCGEHDFRRAECSNLGLANLSA